ncbi:MAG TPA: hypothetical protein VMZ06_00435 [Candidatus Bathyarchaeia archaeon]|nr:hypothetical protein [Candidatus Bathyarchaeia archaeon]
MAKYSSRKAYGDAEGPFGFPMPSALASEVDAVLKGLPPELRDLGIQRRSVIAKATDLQEGERADVSLVTSDAVDRDGEVMLPKGGDWKQFQKNPVVTFAHRYDELPVGRALWIKRAKEEGMNGWIAKTQYTSKPDGWEGPWFPDAVWHLVKSGDLRGKSIGFMITDASPPEEKEIKARPELAGVSRVIRKFTVLEYAVAPVQSNPDAFVLAAAKARDDGLPMETILNETGLILPMGTPTFEGYYKSLMDAPAETEPEPPKPKKRPRIVLTRESLGAEIAKADIAGQVAAQFDRLRGRV